MGTNLALDLMSYKLQVHVTRIIYDGPTARTHHMDLRRCEHIDAIRASSNRARATYGYSMRRTASSNLRARTTKNVVIRFVTVANILDACSWRCAQETPRNAQVLRPATYFTRPLKGRVATPLILHFITRYTYTFVCFANFSPEIVLLRPLQSNPN